MSIIKAIIQIIFVVPFLIIFTGGILFFPAGTLNWIEGWVYILLLLIYYVGTTIYFTIKNPSTLIRRRKLSASNTENLIMIIFGCYFLLLLILPGFDYQLKWTQLPLLFKTIGFIGLIITYILNFWVLKENSFASKGLLIHKDQKVVTTGPYGIVRHPMYVSIILLAFSTPVELGSLISLILALLVPFFLAFRILKEEKMLRKDLSDYIEYTQKVPYRLFPKIW